MMIRKAELQTVLRKHLNQVHFHALANAPCYNNALEIAVKRAVQEARKKVAEVLRGKGYSWRETP